MYNMINMINTYITYERNVREEILGVLMMRKNIFYFLAGVSVLHDRCSLNFIVVIISLHTYTSNQYVVHLKLV